MSGSIHIIIVTIEIKSQAQQNLCPVGVGRRERTSAEAATFRLSSDSVSLQIAAPLSESTGGVPTHRSKSFSQVVSKCMGGGMTATISQLIYTL